MAKSLIPEARDAMDISGEWLCAKGTIVLSAS